MFTVTIESRRTLYLAKCLGRSVTCSEESVRSTTGLLTLTDAASHVPLFTRTLLSLGCLDVSLCILGWLTLLSNVCLRRQHSTFSKTAGGIGSIYRIFHQPSLSDLHDTGASSVTNRGACKGQDALHTATSQLQPHLRVARSFFRLIPHQNSHSPRGSSIDILAEKSLVPAHSLTNICNRHC